MRVMTSLCCPHGLLSPSTFDAGESDPQADDFLSDASAVRRAQVFEAGDSVLCVASFDGQPRETPCSLNSPLRSSPCSGPDALRR
jgi:hypothetical protein